MQLVRVLTPWPAVIFAVDPGNKSAGWSWWENGELCHHADGSLMHALEKCWRQACTPVKRPYVLVIEKHRPHGKWGHKAAVGLERAVGEVTGEAKRIGIPKSRVHRVFPEDWRRPILGGGRHTTGWWKHLARVRCFNDHGVDVDDDEAEAILIGYWATRAPELLQYMPKKLRDTWQG